MRVSKALVIETASQIADERGLNSLSLKAVAEKLNVRTPSLYNHIESLDDLLREVAHKGMRFMNEQMAHAAIGKSDDAAMKSVSVEYLNFIIEHPGVYETIQWATWHGTDETARIFESYIKILSTIISSYNFPSDSKEEILNLFTGLLHGFTTLQVRYAFSNPQKVRNELCNAVDTVLLGVRQRYAPNASKT
ncbi:TetR/AcrR family transcriptional regulator [Enterocloster clostridioformis]|uniref:TetR/AcrR family transcriptional regulator n=1 Tax=Enterocloster clostridioformis TaxID=1531 RepID=UPI0026752600|nr:TetR/AcrR family transcriptional regulator [Enterocloster clostridioformis]